MMIKQLVANGVKPSDVGAADVIPVTTTGFFCSIDNLLCGLPCHGDLVNSGDGAASKHRHYFDR